MRHRNRSERTLEFTLRGHVYKVAPGGTCEVPAELEFALSSRGLPLERDPIEGEKEDEGPELPSSWKGASLPPPGSNARVWLARALEANAEATRVRERVEAAEARAKAAERDSDVFRADLEAALRQRDDALALVEAAGAAKAVGERERERADAAETLIVQLRADLEEATRQRDEALALVGAAGAAKSSDEGAGSSGELAAAGSRGDEAKAPSSTEPDAAGGGTKRHRK